jgi:hypothetical protein
MIAAASVGILLSIAAVRFVTSLGTIAGGPLNPHYRAIERDFGSHQAELRRLICAKNLSDVPGTTNRYRVRWAATDGACRTRCRVQALRMWAARSRRSSEAGPMGAPLVLVAAWVDHEGSVRRLLVGGAVGAPASTIDAVTDRIKPWLGRPLTQPLPPGLEPASSSGLFDTQDWLKRGRVRPGDTIAEIQQPAWFAEQGRLIGPHRFGPGSAFVYWEADQAGRVTHVWISGS